MNYTIHLLDAVAVTEGIPQMNLLRGQVGTVVEMLAPDAYEVEFCDEEGRTFVMAALQESQLMLLRFRPARTA